jgi:hypothetical protein
MAAGGLTAADLDACERDDRWLGHGYLGWRSGPCTRGWTSIVDRAVLELANEHGWDRELLFHWCNSKCGRWFGDDAYGAEEKPTTSVVVERNRYLFDLELGWLPG